MVVLTFLLAKATYDYLLDKQRQSNIRNDNDDNGRMSSSPTNHTTTTATATATATTARIAMMSSPGGNFVIDSQAGGGRLMMLPPPEERKTDPQCYLNSTSTNNIGKDYAIDEDLANYSIKYNSEESTFRSDIRNDWIDAIFGKDYFPISNSTTANQESNSNIHPDRSCSGSTEIKNSVPSSLLECIAVRQGVGAAGIPHHVTYGAVLLPPSSMEQQQPPPPPPPPQQQQQQEKDTSRTNSASNIAINSSIKTTTTTTKTSSIPPPTPPSVSSIPVQSAKQKLGITITRIPLGLYVHAISLDSEAYAVGISPGSILLDINGTLGLLGERSDRALERLWKYAGLFTGTSNKINSSSSSSGHGGDGDDNPCLYSGNMTMPTSATTTKSNSTPVKNTNYKSRSNDNPNHLSSRGSNNQRNIIASSNNESPLIPSSNSNTTTFPSSSSSCNYLQVKKPILLRFYKSGTIYQVTLLSGQPFHGIHWAPCGNFALVQKVSPDSIAARSGVRRGSLVVCVNQTLGLRSLDHVGVARCLRDKFSKGEQITLSMGYTPAASRSGYHERGGEDKNGSFSSSTTPEAGNMISSTTIKKSGSSNGLVRGVEIRPRPVEYSSAMVETLFACTGPGAMDFVDDASTITGNSSTGGLQIGSDKGKSTSSGTNAIGLTFTSITEAASYVAWGGKLPPGVVSSEAASNIILKRQSSSSNSTSNSASLRRSVADNATKGCSPCPALSPAKLLSEWNAVASLARSMAYQSAGSYCETTYTRVGGPFERIVGYEKHRSNSGGAPFTPTECLGWIWEIANNSSRSTTMEDSSSLVAVEKVFDAHLLQLLGVAISPMMGAIEKGQRLSEMLMDIVIDVSLNDICLCQRLYFLLRSFIGELEEQKVQSNDTFSEQSKLAIRCCRYAQRRLSGRMFDKSCGLVGENDRQCNIGYPISRESTNSTSSRIHQQHKHPDYMNLLISPTESTLGHSQVGYPFQELNISSPSSVEDVLSGEIGEERLHQISAPLAGDVQAMTSESSSRENLDKNPSNSEYGTSNPKKKSKNILRMLKGGEKSTRSSKKQYTHDNAFDHSNNASKIGNSYSSTSADHMHKKSPKSSTKTSFSFPFLFHKQNTSSSMQTIECTALPPQIESPPIFCLTESDALSLSMKFENLAQILRLLDNSCLTIERNLMKSFSQKIADWALYPWSARNESALASVTHSFRSELRLINSSSISTKQKRKDGGTVSAGSSESTLTESTKFPILNPVNPTEQLISINADECFILPSAHFPLLLCFELEYPLEGSAVSSPDSLRPSPTSLCNSTSREIIYRTSFEILGIHSNMKWSTKIKDAFAIQCAVSGDMQESGVSDDKWRQDDTVFSCWTSNNILVFETSSNWGHPKTLSFKVSTCKKYIDSPAEEAHSQSELGCGFVDLCPLWKLNDGNFSEARTNIYCFDSAEEFDQQGQIISASARDDEGLELHFRAKVEVLPYNEKPTKRLLLYKHGDDLRQELLAIQFVERCNQILLSSGLDLKLKTFSCQPVGSKTGFIEWVQGTVPLSELCNSSGSSDPGSNTGSRQSSRIKEAPTDEAGALNDSFMDDVIHGRLGDKLPPQNHRWSKHQSLRGILQKYNGSITENPLQDFLRSTAYDKTAPYFVKKDVMATYVKSCAGYCVITYLLGVGDRHLDNILLHHSGNLLHCDYSFILGQDPKTYLPMRITEEMIKGLGGHDSDNFSKFLSYVGAAFLTLRRHHNLHTLLSHVFNMVHANMGDLSINQPPEEAVLAMRGRFRLDLNDDEALAYIENVVEKSITSKMWRAVDVMHSLGKHF